MKAFGVLPALGIFLRPSVSTTTSRAFTQTRWAHKKAQLPIPPTIPLVPDVETFLTVIGRGLKKHAAKFPSWEALFTLTSEQLRELGVDEPRTRRYLLRWRQRYQLGKYGVGGDLKHVVGGRAELRVLETNEDPLVPKRVAINVQPGTLPAALPAEERVRPRGYKVRGQSAICGPYVLPMRGGGAVVTVTEGMWEDKRGRKIDGGERRQAEVRFKKRFEERKKAREANMYI